MEELVDAVWANPKLHIAAGELEKAWLSKEIGAEPIPIDIAILARCMKAAAILSASADPEQRQAAFRIATQAFDLAADDTSRFAAALRVVLGRLGNFPSFVTKDAVDRALPGLPWTMAAEEIGSSVAQTVHANGENIVLSKFQHSLWSTLASGARAAVSAPTSAGKSFVLLNYLASLCAESGPIQIVYIVPTRALITQVSVDLEEKLLGSASQPVEIISVPLDSATPLPDRCIYVLTPERLQVLLHAHPNLSLRLAVIDEAHLIADGSRGILLQWVVEDLLERNEKTQLLFASPIIRNLSVFGDALGLGDIVERVSREPSVAQNIILVEVDSAPKGKVSLLSASADSEEVLLKATLNQTLASKYDKLVHIPAHFGAGAQNIVYANGSADAEKIAMQLSDRFSAREATPAQQQLSALAKEIVHGSYVLSKTVLTGIGFHYSNIPAVLRKAVEDAFGRGELDYIVCTSTLLQGVNTPAKNIFMCLPEKGYLKPIESTDFWNLAGRAGRLRKEFHGNIFLIDYSKWKTQPLSGPKDNVVVPAIQQVMQNQRAELMHVIRDDQDGPIGSKDLSTQTAFTRLFVGLKTGTLGNSLEHVGLEPTSAGAREIVAALNEASGTITLPNIILRQSPNISAHRQEELFLTLRQRMTSAEAAKRLIPLHPREASAFRNYADILELCHSVVLGIDTTKNLHRFHALLAQRWMTGWPLPRIIDEQIKRKPPIADRRKIIRDTLDIVESQIRFSVVRLFTCYNAVLVQALIESDLSSLMDEVSDLPVFLEVGASDKTMISLIALGLSRPTALRLNDIASDKNLDPAKARAWLAEQDLVALGLSPVLEAEVRRVLVGSGAARASDLTTQS
ncbi:DEAD/DEAH box helicase [Brevundimonas sp.]|uniref:DEAD/DEAH box helicase n=1 Tax=Brevundimonas sp. TaxID=1871086 RepID=UPI003511A23A